MWSRQLCCAAQQVCSQHRQWLGRGNMPCWSHSCHPLVWLGPLLATKLSVNHFRKLLRGSPVCFLSLAPDGSTPSVPASLPLWQEAEQLGVSPSSSTSVTPALGCGFELPAAALRSCMALFLLLFFLTVLILLWLPVLTAGAVRLWQ